MASGYHPPDSAICPYGVAGAVPIGPVRTPGRRFTLTSMTRTPQRTDSVYDPAAGRDPTREAREIEAAIGGALRRNSRLHGHHITATAGPEGLVTLTGTVATQELRREVELSCWTVLGVFSLHDHLIVGR